MKESLTDWERLDALQNEDIDLSDMPEITPEMFAKAVVRRGLKPAPESSRSPSAWMTMCWSGSVLKVRDIKPVSIPCCARTWKHTPVISNEITAMHNRSGRERKSYYFYFYFASRARRMAHACREMVDSI